MNRVECGICGCMWYDRDTITTQPVVLIRNTGVLIAEQTARTLAYPSMRCPITNKPFAMKDVLPIAQAQSGFAATGKVEASRYRPAMN